MKNRINFRKYAAIAVFAVLAIVFLPTTCTEDMPDVEEPVIHVTGVTINLHEVSLLVGSKLTLTASVEPAEATDKIVIWNTSDDHVATINSEGELTAIATGTSMITATTDDGEFTTTCIVTVTDEVIPVTGIAINPSEVSLLVGNTLTLTASVEPAEATDKIVIWKTDDDRVATVNSAGELTAVAPGTATITATTDDGEFTATCTVTVTEEIISVTGVITMTTQSSEVSLYIIADNNIVIDWGDGEINNANDYSFFHSYSDVSEHSITITGVNIKSLNCSRNQLTTLDVSSYPALKMLYCYNNQLTKLDISSNTELKELCCSNNSLTVLDVSKNTALEDLLCDNNLLTTLDVSSNIEIKIIDCSYNQLTTSALNDLFGTLRNKPLTKSTMYHQNFSVTVHYNPGAFDCDVSIAEEKGWRVYAGREYY